MTAWLILLLLQPGPDDTSDAPPATVVASTEHGAPTLPIVSLAPGTDVSLELLDTLSTKITQKGETFDLRVTEDVVVDGWVLIPAGTMAVGEVTRSEAKDAFGKSGKLEARILYLRLPDRSLRLTGHLGRKGQGQTTETVLAAIAGGTLAFAVTGKSAVLDAGTLLVATTDRAISLRAIGRLDGAPQ